ncbi:hypothetical protein GCM10023094_16050 [Rhodococcus olei]|uniref:Methyltransferase type 11 domain-containing protein n=1 Tax=Rhodococcus olei TaxID=2161675 RepID=A0ABP8NWN9_9NOCA
MHQHAHHHPHHGHGHGHDDAGLAETLDLDAEALGPVLDEVTRWASRFAPDEVRTVADIGAGTGTGTLALARRFAAADVVAIDRSETMLDRVRDAAVGRGLADRLRLVRADLDTGWPAVGAVDVAWASSSLHEVADPDRLLREVRDTLTPGGLLVVVEMDGLPRFLPDSLGNGLEARCHAVLSESGWNAHPDWRPHLERAGLEVADQRTFAVDRPAPTNGRYARVFLARVRDFLADKLDAGDLATLDHLLSESNADSPLHSEGLRIRGSRTVWAARRG